MTVENFIAGEFKRLADVMPGDTRWRVTLGSYVPIPDLRRGPAKVQYPTKVLWRSDYADLSPVGDAAGRDGLTRDQAIERVPDLIRAQGDLKQARIILTPYSPTHYLSHLDDCSQDALQALIADGFLPCAVIQTSPGKANVIFRAPRPAGQSPHAGHEINKGVSQALNARYGDPSARNAVQPFRWPGFTNLKPKYERSDGGYPLITLTYAVRQDCPGFAKLLAAEPVVVKIEPPHVSVVRQVVRQIKRGALDRDGSALRALKTQPHVRAYCVHASAIRRDAEAGKLNIKRREDGRLCQFSIDGMAGRRMRQTNWSIEQIAIAIAVGTNIVRDHFEIEIEKNPTKYSTKIADHVFQIDLARFTDERWRIAEEVAAGIDPPILAARRAAVGWTSTAPPPARRVPRAVVIADPDADATRSVLTVGGRGRRMV